MEARTPSMCGGREDASGGGKFGPVREACREEFELVCADSLKKIQIIP